MIKLSVDYALSDIQYQTQCMRRSQYTDIVSYKNGTRKDYMSQRCPNTYCFKDFMSKHFKYNNTFCFQGGKYYCFTIISIF